MSFFLNIIKETKENDFFRKVLFTGAKSQLVVMDIKPGEDIGEEVHTHVEQILFFLSGEGKAALGGVESPVAAGDVYVVTPGTRHNFINTGSASMKVYTVYVPPNHIDGTVHETKAAAIADAADEEFGHRVE
jgi:mannose-6-phosphate isomerase-like protein (cupin superfamily)